MSAVIRSLDSLFPPFSDTVAAYVEKTKEYNFYIFETYRSLERQLERYSVGREQKNGLWVIADSKSIVTNAKPGAGFHTYGLAFDSVPDGDLAKTGIQWNWTNTYKDVGGKDIPVPWSKIGYIGKKLGLEWAGDWKGGFTELCHFQNTYGCKASELYQILTSDGLESVWKFINGKMKLVPTRYIVPIQLEKPPAPVTVVAVEDLDSHAKAVAVAKNQSVWGLFKQLLCHIFRK